MQFKRLKKNYKKQIIIGGLILVCITSAITITKTRAKYKLTEDIPLVKGTINYKEPDMRIMAVNISEDGTNYIETDTIPTEGYNFNSEKSVCKKTTTDLKDEGITIKYKEGKIDFLGITQKGTKCYLYFDKKEPTASETILNNITIKEGTPDFSQIATTDEGVYKVNDGMYGGYSYYWRGSVTNNYVKFGGFCWRIIRINGDSSMRLIYDGSSCHANGTSTDDNALGTDQQYNGANGNSTYVGWTYNTTEQRTLAGQDSYLKLATESWYKSKIENNTKNSSKVADGKFCNDRNTSNNEPWRASGNSQNYAGYDRLYTNYTPSLSCNSGDMYTLKVGAITIDEVIFAGGNDQINDKYFLYNGKEFWTMTPSQWYYHGNNYYAKVFVVGNLGAINMNNVSAGFRRNFCPVINLKADIQFQADGNGTLNNPYVVA